MAQLVYPTNEFLHFHNELASVVEHTAGYISIDWKPAPMRTAHLREVYSRALELLTYTRCGRILNDHQLMAPLLPSDTEWLVREWVPLAIKVGGYRRCAVIQGHELFNRQTASRTSAQPGITVRYFHTRPDAIAWVLAE